MLNDEQIQKVRGTMQTGGWKDVVVPLVVNRGRELTKLALRMPTERGAPYKDMEDRDAMNHIRGRIEEIEWLISFFENEVNAFDYNRQRDELARQANGVEANTLQP